MKASIMARRWLAALMCLTMLLQNAPLAALAVDSGSIGLCQHHAEHTLDCGYSPAAEGQPCTHAHDASCGFEEVTEQLCDKECKDTDGDGAVNHAPDCAYTIAKDGKPCGHTHDEACGYKEEIKQLSCSHVHDETCGYSEAKEEAPCDRGCTDTNGDGIIDHAQDCAYAAAREGSTCTHQHTDACYVVIQQGSPCTHTHDKACGYVAPKTGVTCSHVHDETCGYVEAQEGQPCRYETEGCPYCIVSWSWVETNAVIQTAEDGSYLLALPGVSPEAPLTKQSLADSGLLPSQVTAEAENGQVSTLELTWDLTALPEEGAADGSYAIQAAIPEDYDLTEDARALVLMLQLGGGNTLEFEPREDITPEPSFIVVQKSISGLTAEQIKTLQHNLVITATGEEGTYTLQYGVSEGVVSWRQVSESVWSWRINGVVGGNYTVSETGCDPQDDLQMPEGAALHASGTGNITIEAADIGLGIEEETTCSHVDWPLYAGCFFAGTLTKNRGSIVITDRAPSASQRAAIEEALIGGVWKTPVYYYSLNSLAIDSENTNPDYHLPISILDSSGGTVTTLNYYPNATYASGNMPGEIRFSDTSVWQHVAKVTYNTGSIQVGDIQITNAYTQPVTLDGLINLKIRKTLTGRDWKPSDVFTFTITAEGNAPLPAETTVSINGSDTDKTVNFGDITYTAPGTYVYTIKENATTIPGVSADTAAYTVTVTVANQNGVLTVTPTYQKAGTVYNYSSTGALEFTNVYSVESAKVKLTGHKHLSGQELTSGQFSFYIDSVRVDDTSYDDFSQSIPAPLPSVGLGEANAITNGSNGGLTANDVFFGELTFTEENAGHSYTYVIKEVIPEQPALGYTYDEGAKEVTYRVSLETDAEDQSQHVKVEVSPTWTEHGYFTFDNSYAPVETKVTPAFTKTLLGRDMKPGERFGFTLTANSQNPQGASIAAGGTTAEVSGAVDGQEVNIRFGMITFTKPGSYEFFVQETSWNDQTLPVSDAQGLTFDTARYSVIYKVEDRSGQLTVTNVSYSSNGHNLTNTYHAASAETVLYVEKLVSGNAPEGFWIDKTFGFTLTAVDGAPMPVENTATVTYGSANNKANFGSITFNQAGEYSYTIVEENKGQIVDGITYSNAQIDVTVTVADNQEGELVATVSYGVSGATAAQFTNIYETVTVSGTKTWKDDDENSRPQSITIKLLADGIQVKEQTVVAEDDWEWTFSDLPKYNGSREITYTVTEAPVEDYETQVDGYNVTNTYVQPVDLTLQVSKSIDGRDWQEKDSFTFSITGSDGAPMPTESTVTITDETPNKTRAFGDITYRLADAGKTYTYTIREDQTVSAPGITPDTAYYTVTVEVSLTDQVLHVTPSYTKTVNGAASQYVPTNGVLPFVNTYDAAAATVALNGVKVLQGGTLQAGQFRFYLESVAVDGQTPITNTDEANAANVPLPQNAGSGTALGIGEGSTVTNGIQEVSAVSFGNLTFTKEHIGHTYTYYLKEVNDGAPGYSYDAGTKVVTIAVTAEDSSVNPGKQEVVATVTGDSSAAGLQNAYFKFENTYNATGVLVGATNLKVSKTLEGRAWKDGDSFTFSIAGQEGAPMPAVTEVTITDTTENHGTNFGDISYTVADVGKAYTYTIVEEEGSLAGITYSQAAYEVTVSISDNGDGTLNVTSSMVQTNNDKGEESQLTAEDNVASFVNISDAKITLKLVPADIITYMRGNDGYDGAVDGSGNPNIGNTDMPKPMFYLTLVAEGGDEDHTAQMQEKLNELDIAQDVVVTAEGSDGSARRWKITLAGQDENGKNLYYMDPDLLGQDEVRVTYTDINGNVQVDDEFTPANALNTPYKINLYTGRVVTNSGRLELQNLDETYQDVATAMDITGTGTLKVCFVEQSGNPVTNVQTGIAAPVGSGSGAVTAPAGTNFTLNKTTVPVARENVALLFDKVYDYESGGTAMAKAFHNRADQALGPLEENATRYYDARYLDLVDVNNGNTWVLADQPVTVYWGYPEGTDQNTEFHLLHFFGLERQNSTISADVEHWATVDPVTINKGVNGISFTVNPDTNLSNFGPFVLVWERTEEGTAEISVTKAVSGNAAADFWEGKTFTFQLSAEQSDAPMPEGTGDVAVVTYGSGNNKASFGKILYNVDDIDKEYTYLVTEQTGTLDGVKYSKEVYRVTVTVDQAVDGNLTVSTVTTRVKDVDGRDTANTQVNDLVFTNGYVPEPVSVEIPVVKDTKGGTSQFWKGKTFQFKLRPYDDDQAFASDTCTIQIGVNDNTSSFGPYVFEEAGVYRCVITEVDGGTTAKNVRYDDREIVVTVTVTDSGESKLTAEVTYKDSAEEDCAAFVNRYVWNSTPKTGDDTNYTLWITLVVVGILGAGATVLIPGSKRRKKED